MCELMQRQLCRRLSAFNQRVYTLRCMLTNNEVRQRTHFTHLTPLPTWVLCIFFFLWRSVSVDKQNMHINKKRANRFDWARSSDSHLLYLCTYEVFARNSVDTHQINKPSDLQPSLISYSMQTKARKQWTAKKKNAYFFMATDFASCCFYFAPNKWPVRDAWCRNRTYSKLENIFKSFRRILELSEKICRTVNEHRTRIAWKFFLT